MTFRNKEIVEEITIDSPSIYSSSELKNVCINKSAISNGK